MRFVELAWLIPALPLLSAALIAMFGKKLPGKGSEIGILSIGVTVVLAVGLAIHTFTNSPVDSYERYYELTPLGDGIVVQLGMLVDGLTSMMFLLVTFVSLMVHIYSREYMKGEVRFTFYYSMLSLFTFSMLLLVIANNTLQAIVGWELVGVCSYLLIGFYWEEKSNQDAANKAFLTTKFADVGLMVGVVVLFKAMAETGNGTFNILELTHAASAGELPTGLLVLGTLLIFLGAVGKSGQMPLHVWLPDAMAGPTPVSALIHAATMVTAGVFLVARLYPVYAQSAVAMATIAIVGTITLFFAGFVAMVQDDIKKVLAYSTVSQLGYMMAALGIGGYTAGIFHLFTHGFFKALLFLGSGSLIHAVHSNNMSDMGGLRKSMPHTFWTFVVGSLALAGFPLTAGFFSKDEILVSAQSWGNNGFITGDLVFWLGLAAAGVTTFYMARAVFLIFFGTNRSHHAPHESGKLILVPLMLLAVLSLAVGVIGAPFWPQDHNFETWTATHTLEETTYPFLAGDDHAVEGEGEGEGAPEQAPHGLAPVDGIAASGALATEATPDGEGGHSAAVLHGPPAFHADIAGMALLVFLLATGLAWKFYGRGKPEKDPTLHMGAFTRVLENKYYLDDIGYRFIVVPVRDKLSAFAYWTNQEVIDATVKGTGAATIRAAEVTYRTIDQKIVDGAVNGAAFSAAWWSSKVKRIQSGDVQRYAGALVAGVVLLVLVFAAS